MKLNDIFALESHGPDTAVGTGPQYPWGGLYGGQIVAQALIAAADTAADTMDVHSLRAYFIRRGDHNEPVRYEVDRIRNGRSFLTRRVVARQATGAILNLEASFQQLEESEEVDTVLRRPTPPAPETIESSSWSPIFERRFIDDPTEVGSPGIARAWLKTTEPLSDSPVLHQAALAFMSGDLPTDAVIRCHPVAAEPERVREKVLFVASLDHTIWFHRPFRADSWLLHDFECGTFVGGRGLAIGRIFSENGQHVATVSQECLLRDSRMPSKAIKQAN